jgi:hypothetical protein
MAVDTISREIAALSIEYLPIGDRFLCHGSTSTVNHLSPPLPRHQGRPREVEEVGELEHRGSNAYSKRTLRRSSLHASPPRKLPVLHLNARTDERKGAT